MTTSPGRRLSACAIGAGAFVMASLVASPLSSAVSPTQVTAAPAATESVSADSSDHCATDPNLARQAVRGNDGGTLSRARAAALEADLAARLAAKPARGISLLASTITVPVYLHVIRKGTSASDGTITSAQATGQISALNSAYSASGAPFRFSLVGTDYSTNSAWFAATSGSSAEAAMKSALHKGDVNSLNLYTLNVAGSLGWSSLPANASTNLANDGVVVRFTTLPGGSYTGYNTGDTAVHEVGHWLGLYHVFQGGCTGPGDYVTDTPPQAYASYACSATDTCAAAGLDPVSNYMGYTPDSCMTRFSSGQVTRMQTVWSAYR